LAIVVSPASGKQRFPAKSLEACLLTVTGAESTAIQRIWRGNFTAP
jgi:hypothetical protein